MAGEEAVIDDERRRLDALAALGVLDTPPEDAYDDLAHLAGELCSAPVALVSFVASDRQWFKARVGFAPCETDLQSSVCRFVLDAPDILVIPDLALDPRTLANPLVAGEPHIRFYAGAPLRISSGEVLGSLCVIDTQPRPDGLTERQAGNLRRLAAQVVGQLELRRMVRQRDAAFARQDAVQESLSLSEAHWRSLFENLQEGFLVAQPLRDSEGRIADWRYLHVNPAWSELIGLDGASVIGRTVREVLPSVEQSWIDLAGVVDTGVSVTFTSRVDQLDRWYEGRASALGPDLFGILFLDVTDRVRTDEARAAGANRKTALAELGDALRPLRTADAMSYVAAEVMGRTLGAARAGHGAVDAGRETVVVPPDWRAPGVVSVAGEHSFRTYGSFIEDLKEGRPVVIPNVAVDPRTAGEGAAALLAIDIRALVNMPVLDGGALASITFVNFNRPREIGPEELDFIRAVADRTQVGIARLAAEESQAVLNGEISHRLKNILAMVQSLAAQTLRTETSPAAMAAFNQRLAALSKAQDALLQAQWQSADLRTLLDEVLDLVGVKSRFEGGGPPVRLGPRATMSTSLLLHELGTNAQKYGALSRPTGRIVVDWRLEGREEAELVLDWREEGGPPAVAPTRKGFGTRLLKLGLVGTGGSQLTFGEGGFSASFRAPVRQVEQA